MKTSQVSEALSYCIAGRLPVLLEGAPGVGKSDLVTTAAAQKDADLIISHPVVSDPTDYKGLPWPGKGNKEAIFLPFGDMAKAINAKKKTVWFLDDLGQAPGAVQAACMQLLLARRVNEHVLPDCVTFVAATNGRTHRANVSGILEPVKSRFVTIISVVPDLDDWALWAFQNGIKPEIIGFLRFRQDLFNAFAPTADMKNSPSPRTWHHVSQLMTIGIPSYLELEMFSGAVGEAATEFVGFLKVCRDLPSIDGIILDPERTKIPKEPSALFAVASGLASRAKKLNFGRILKYTERLADAGFGEMAGLTIRDCERRCPEVANTPEFVAMLTTPMGALYQS